MRKILLFFIFILFSCSEEEPKEIKEYELRRTTREVNARTSPNMGRRGFIYSENKMYINDATIPKNHIVHVIDSKGNWILCKSSENSPIEYWIHTNLTKELDSLNLMRNRLNRFVDKIHLGTVFTKDEFISERDIERIIEYYELCCPEYDEIRIVKNHELIFLIEK